MARTRQDDGHLSPSPGLARRSSERIIIEREKLYSFRTSDAELEVKSPQATGVCTADLSRERTGNFHLPNLFDSP
jgi:hypothetical protein